MANNIDDLHVLSFKDTITHLCQQKDSRFMMAVDSMRSTGEGAQAVQNLAPGDMAALTAPTYAGALNDDGWYGDTEWDQAEHFQRWVYPSAFKRALPVHRNNLVQSLTDPKSAYAENIVNAFNRKKDDIIIAAALGNAKQGPYDNQADIALPTGQKIAAGGTGLLLSKVEDAWGRLMAAECDEDEMWLAVNAKGMSQLKAQDQVVSADYNTNRILSGTGKVDTWNGFKLIQTERLPIATNVVSGFAFTAGALKLALWRDLEVRVDERSDKNYTWQIYGDTLLGAVRAEDSRVVQIDFDQSVAV